jgi:uncharacterized protein YutE (UPF0331/DUF86 family)
MPQFDREVLIRLSSELRKAVGRLRELGRLPKEVFLGDLDKVGSAKYHFIMAIESAIDMCNHIISRNGFRAPEDYADVFKVMGEVGAFDGGLCRELQKMARFRNRLVHLYFDVDDGQVHGILQSGLEDFGRFLAEIGRFLGSTEDVGNLELS